MKVYHINIRVFITLINQQFDVLIINTEIKKKNLNVHYCESIIFRGY